MKGGAFMRKTRDVAEAVAKARSMEGAALLLALCEEDFRPYMANPHFWDCLHAEQRRRNRRERLLKLCEIKKKHR